MTESSNDQFSKLAIDIRVEIGSAVVRSEKTWPGLLAEHVSLPRRAAYDFKMRRGLNYVALHQMKKLDGEIRIPGLPTNTTKDVRNLLSFVPPDCEAEGWTLLGNAPSSFIAVSLDDRRNQEFTTRISQLPPRIFFDHAGMRATVQKFQNLITAQDHADSMHGEVLGMLLQLEILDAFRERPIVNAVHRGGLTPRQVALVEEFIEANMQAPISLSDLAGLVHLSRFHFIRAFKQVKGPPPHQYLLKRRIERAAELILERGMPLPQVARQAGFSGMPQFTRTFRRFMGMPPARYRRAVGG